MIIAGMSSSSGAVPAGGALRLADWGLIRAAGADARTFLQGQLTQDVVSLPPGQARLAGYCSPKGRLLASFVVWAAGGDELLLACSADLLPETRERLARFVLRSRCKLTDASGEFDLWGLAAAAPDGADLPTPSAVRQAGGGLLIGLPAARLGTAVVARALWVAPAGGAAPALPPLAGEAWCALEAASGVARITAATREQFVPQMVNFDLVGGVNFQKGCYPGQEVVARSQYRGTTKRRTALFACGAAASPGQELFHSGDPGQPAGMVVLAGTISPGSHLVLAEVKLAALEGGTLHLGSAAGPQLERRELPYTVAVEAD